MAAGLRYKWQGSKIEVLAAFTADSPPQAITGVSQANPAVVTSAGHGLTQGDVVRISAVVGMDELNGGVFNVGEVVGTTFELAETDSTGYGAWISGGTIEAGAWSNLCELTNYNRQGGSSPEIPATTICSTAQEFELGLGDFGTTQLSFNFAPRTAVQGALHAFWLSGDITGIRVTLPKSGGVMTQFGFVQQESETAGNGGLWTAQATLKNTGNRYDVLA